MKRLWLILLVLAFVSCSKKETEKNSVIGNDTEKETVKTFVPEKDMKNEIGENTPERVIVCAEYRGNIMFELGQVKAVFDFNPPKEILRFDPVDDTVEIVVFETSTGEDFVRLNTMSHKLGIRAERVWIGQTYPEFSEISQALMEIEIMGDIYPCDVLTIENKATGEIKRVYFEISSFYYNTPEENKKR